MSVAGTSDIERKIRRYTRALWMALGILVASEILGIVGVVRPAHVEVKSFVLEGNYFFASAFFGSFVIFASARPGRRILGLTAAMGVALEAAMAIAHRGTYSVAGLLETAGAGLGVAAVGGAALLAWQSQGPLRRRWLATLLATSLIPVFLLLSGTFTGLTVALHPATYDTLVYAGDATFGLEPSWTLGQVIVGSRPLQLLLTGIYIHLPLAFSIVFAAERRANAPGRDVLFAFLLAGFLGFACYHAFPVIGPRYMFPGWPNEPPEVVTLALRPLVAPPVLRNCIPSLHTTWALLLFWNARPLSRRVRAFTAVWLAGTLLATVGLGFHYFLDLVMAVPFACAVQSLASRGVAWARPERWFCLAFGVVLTVVWMTMLRYGIAVAVAHPEIVWALTVVTVPIALLAEARLAKLALSAREPADPAPAPQERADGVVRKGIGLAFFLSGGAGLAYEVVFAKELSVAFGSAALASATVLATYMGGMAVGAWLGGTLTTRRTPPLKIYAFCEGGVAIFCAASPWMFPLVRHVYAWIAPGRSTGSAGLVALQLLLGSLCLLPPTILMGVTLPVLTGFFSRSSSRLGRSVATLYGLNTLGAASGALVTGYVVLPFFGVTMTTLAAVGANLAAALLGLRLSARAARTAPTEPAPPPAQAESDVEQAEPSLSVARSLRVVGLLVLGVGGVVTLALETTYVHLLAVVVGSSTFAFSLMLFSFLLGLGGGSTLGRELLKRALPARTALGWIQAALVITVLLGVFFWQAIPDYFASYEHYPMMRAFGEREFVRFVVCCIALVPPAFCIGASYPVAIEVATTGLGAQRTVAMGRAAALNTLGNIGGTLAGGFLLMPMLGSLHTLHVLAGLSGALAVVCLFPDLRARRPTASVLVPALALFAAQPRVFDWTRIAGGGNVYFAKQHYGVVIDHSESLDGGLSTVSRSIGPDGHPVLTLMTNGKFQGDDSVSREMRAQVAFSLIPLFHTASRERALVIGIGTGVSTRTMSDAGFAAVDAADLSADIVRLARTHFVTVNGGALDRPHVNVLVADGRNVLLVRPAQYDLIGIELSSIWFAGAASLYNQEFYEIASRRLNDHGVFQQWIQLHHLGQDDIVSILATLRSVFEHVWLYFAGNQGVLVACHYDCRPGPETFDRIDTDPSLRVERELLGESAAEARASTILLEPDDVDRYLEAATSMGLDARALISNDDNLFLEYHTPRGNVRQYQSSLEENVFALRRFSSVSR